jgi:hypothetical protein
MTSAVLLARGALLIASRRRGRPRLSVHAELQSKVSCAATTMMSTMSTP